MRSPSMLLLICAALGSGATLAQSLSIVKQGQSNFWIEASAPATNPHTLQASANLHLWVDIHDPVQGQFSGQLGGTGVLQRYFRLMPSSPPAPPIIVMLLGDSLTGDGTGWGSGIYGYFKPNATVLNYAMPWTSTRDFLQSAAMQNMLLVKPHYVLINYGAVDAADFDPFRFTTIEEFRDNLRTIVQTVRGFNGVPILVTLHSPQTWDQNGHVVPFAPYQERNAVIKPLAAELQTPLIDLSQLTTELLNQLGPSGAAFMHYEPGGPYDVVHLSFEGAVVVSRLVVNALPDSLGPYLIGIFDPPPIL